MRVKVKVKGRRIRGTLEVKVEEGTGKRDFIRDPLTRMLFLILISILNILIFNDVALLNLLFCPLPFCFLVLFSFVMQNF